MVFNGSESTSSLIGFRKKQMKKVLQERRTSQDSYERLCDSFETAVKTKPSHRLHRHESLEKLKEEFGSIRASMDGYGRDYTPGTFGLSPAPSYSSLNKSQLTRSIDGSRGGFKSNHI